MLPSTRQSPKPIRTSTWRSRHTRTPSKRECDPSRGGLLPGRKVLLLCVRSATRAVYECRSCVARDGCMLCWCQHPASKWASPGVCADTVPLRLTAGA
jgi:hypothetical protein